MNNSPQHAVTDFVSAVAEIKSELLQILPGIFSGLIILLVGVIVAYFVKWLCSIFVQLLVKMLPERINEKSIVRKNIMSLGKGLGRIAFFAIVVLAVATMLNKMGLDIASNWLQGLAKYLPNIIVALVIILLGWKLKNMLSNILFHSFSRTELKHSSLASGAISWSVFIISVLVSLEQVGVDMSLVVTISTVLIGVGSGGIVLTFALGSKSTIADILSCYQLNRFFKVGQTIEFAGYKGTIESIGPTFVLIDTEKGKVTLPGSRFSQEATLILSELEK